MAVPSNLVDPHIVFANGENVDISNLTMYAELKVTKRNRTATGNSSLAPIIINFMGAGDAGVFTTDFTDNKENFGISRIEYKMSSSYVPQIDIEFMDVRGQALFNDAINSKYKVLFDMPPPIFELTIKGYYGQAVNYKLHLLRQNVSVDDNGCFIVKSSFVGMTFAPLADILLDYLEVAPYLANSTTLTDGDINTTLELRKAAKDLINEIKTATAKDVSYLQEKSDLLEDLKTYQNKDYVEEFVKKINDINTNDGQNNSVFAKRETNRNIVTVSFKYIAAEAEYASQSAYESLYNQIQDTKQFMSTSHVNINVPTIPATTEDLPEVDYQTDEYVKVCTIDFTNVNNMIADSRNNHASDIAQKQDDTIAKVNTMASRLIKGGPTLYNVLNIILGDAKIFVQELRKTCINAANNRKTQTGDSQTGESYNNPFPLFYVNKPVDGRLTKVRSIPTNETWDEVQFVNKYINAKNKAVSFDKLAGTNFDAQNVSNYVPINPFDGLLGTQQNIYANVGASNLYDVIVQRGSVLANATFEENVGKVSNATELAKIYGQIEAYNITNVLQYRPELLNMLINDINKPGFEFSATTSSFAVDMRAGDIVSAVTNATVGFTYKGGTIFDIKTKEDFGSLGGIPKERKETSGTDAANNQVQSLLNDLTDAVTHNWLVRQISGDKKVVISQQNIPLFQDDKIVDGNGVFNDNSIYVFGHSIFAFPEQITDFSADSLLKSIATSPYVKIYSPFEIHQFKEMGAIHEVPFFVLAWWGYQWLNRSSLPAPQQAEYNTIPKKMGDLLADKYTQFTQYVNTVSVQATIKQYLGNMSGVPKRPNNSSNTDTTEFAKTEFVEKFSEIHYLILGENNIFASDKPDKTINFAAQFIQQAFWTSLKNELKKQRSNIAKQQRDEQKRIDATVRDNDIRTELYYAFKSFSDRWLLDSIAVDFDKMLTVDDSFLMVDRAFNNIGQNLIMDLEPLYSDLTPVDTSLYTLLLNLLSKNNLEFFSMPTYVNYKDAGILWSQSNAERIFGTTQSVRVDVNPKFICMYVGGTSAQLDMPRITEDATSHADDGGNIGDIDDLSGNSNIQAFIVRYGTQTQSFFTRIELDQAEFKETNESIKLLDNIAKSGDANGNTTEIKSNNLFNVYQQRSYTATVHAMGNMMIQPTMYFQLENIAMWKGAYMILDVHHSITANKVMTKFRGVRVPQVMKPYVTDYTIIANVGLGSPLTQSAGYGGSSSVSGGRGISATELRDIKSTLPHIGNNNTNRLSNREKALLDVIAFTEGTLGQGQKGYDVLYTDKRIQAWNPDYRLGHGGDAWKNSANGLASTAAGRYQFLYDTWTGYSTGDGATQGDPKNKPFSLVNQDLTGVRLIKEKRLKPYGLDIEEITHDNFINYIDVLALEWASFPFYGTIKVRSKSPTWSVGKGFYDGQGGRFTVDELWVVYSLALKKYNEGLTADLTTELNKLVAGAVTPAQAAHIATLHPSVQQRFTDLIGQIQTQTGWKVNITSSYRNYASQEEQAAKNTKNVQNAPAGYSLHEYGLAIDINLIKGNTTLYKNDSKEAWIATGAVAIAKNLGFFWGGDFNDYADNVHFEIMDGQSKYSGSLLFAKAQKMYGGNLKNTDLRKISLT